MMKLSSAPREHTFFLAPTVFRSMDEGPETPPPERPPEPPPEPPPPREEIKIRDLGSRPRGCSVCGKDKEPYIQFEVDGVLEYTCKECYEGEVIELVACRKCGAAMDAKDKFCGKCGAPRAVRCASCGADLRNEDQFCGKCGTTVT